MSLVFFLVSNADVICEWTQRTSESKPQEREQTDAPTTDSERQIEANFGGRDDDNPRLAIEVARQFRRDFSALQSELEAVKEGLARFEARMLKMSVAVAAHLGEDAQDTREGVEDVSQVR